MISVDEAVQRVMRAFAPLPAENSPADRSLGPRARARCGRRARSSARADVGDGRLRGSRGRRRASGAELAVIGEAPAGRPFAGHVGAGQAVRIFTGGVVPEGADAVVIQEDAIAHGATRCASRKRRSRARTCGARGLDFRVGDRAARTRTTHLAARCRAPRRGRFRPRRGHAQTARRRRGDRRRTHASRRAARARRHRRLLDLCAPIHDPRLGRRSDRSRDHPRPRGGVCAVARCGARHGSDHHARRRVGRRSRSDPERAGAARVRARFLEDRDAARQAAHLRPAERIASDRAARQSRSPRWSAPFCSCSRPSPRCSARPTRRR